MPLQSRWVEEVLARLQVRYGTRWSSLWQGIDPELIKADWAEQLDGMAPENIRKALSSLPDDFPPTATAFRKLGHIRAEAEVLALPAPDPAGIKRIATAMTAAQGCTESPAEWMARLDRDVRAGTASHSRREHHRIATANGYYGGPSAAEAGDFTPASAESLPPAMRSAEVPA